MWGVELNTVVPTRPRSHADTHVHMRSPMTTQTMRLTRSRYWRTLCAYTASTAHVSLFFVFGTADAFLTSPA